MSPIEHVWDALDRCVRLRVPVSANIQHFHTDIEDEWGHHSTGHNKQPDQFYAKQM
jgi:hypothetical protein